MNILLVAYFYPPSRDTGAARPATMARYLERLGHRVAVLTTRAYGELPDDAERRVFRTPDLQLARARLAGERNVGSLYDADTYSGRPHPLSRVLVPDPLVAAWAPFARARALRLARTERFDAVITSAPPESSHLVGRVLQRRRGVPWVAELRDAWTFESLRPPFPTRAQRALDVRLERRWLGGADAVVCLSEAAAADLRRRGIADPVVITNGWDPEQVETAPDSGVALDPDRVSLVYTGRFGRGRDEGALVDAVALLAREDPTAAARLELVVAGPITKEERDTLGRDVSPARVLVAGSLPRERAVALQREADALLLIAHPESSWRLNYKLFEYLAAGRPILALAEGTEAGRVAGELGAVVVDAGDAEAIGGALRGVLSGGIFAPAEEAAARYAYPAPAEQMVATIEAALMLHRDGKPPYNRG
jgi:glycosyltransferase involved in cell wall biosynthesis